MILKKGSKDWDRFWSKVKRGPGCWMWVRATDKDGYGIFRLNDKQKRSHRLVYEIGHGSIPQGMRICHTCDVTGCVRPSHLFIGTDKDNKRDAMKKGRDIHGMAHFNCKLTDKQVRQIRKDKRSLRNIAKEYNIDYTNVSKIKNRTSWKHIK